MTCAANLQDGGGDSSARWGATSKSAGQVPMIGGPPRGSISKKEIAGKKGKKAIKSEVCSSLGWELGVVAGSEPVLGPGRSKAGRRTNGGGGRILTMQTETKQDALQSSVFPLPP